ncbi:hypothetical protein FNU76_16415 [Chitinimonas arctica]|uniref:DNA gyrase subunit B n=1 Tax=Chitinimonas arctica TaxID=2594795 RepID=A0A516SI11_9NEIS|nr:hypothetical protein [Chitinimonas arctica]QDQ27799.1 hypothetical protein FNU76_16415 [Chitinimonas arctica]
MRTALLTLLTLAYPPLVYFCLDQVEPRWLALLLAGLALARALATRERLWLAAAAGTLLLAAASALGNALLPLKLYPVLVNAALLVLFGLSLYYPPSVIERLARRQTPELPPAGVRYTRRVTQVWCGFFVLNGGIALATAVWASDAAWALYNGLIAYVLMAVLFGAEWLWRQRVKAAHG